VEASVHHKTDFAPRFKIPQWIDLNFNVQMNYKLIPMQHIISIEVMVDQDWPTVRTIYAEGIQTGNATFEKSPPDWVTWNAGHVAACRLVARSAGKVRGWAPLSPVSSRCVYAGVAEVSVYVAQQARGWGIGAKLLASLIEGSEREGIWTLQAGIFPENISSVELHKRLGFRVVGTREKLGSMDGRWRDVLLMERRSRISGIYVHVLELARQHSSIAKCLFFIQIILPDGNGI
jgi:L-amino acid N-acyltransferase YncA